MPHKHRKSSKRDKMRKMPTSRTPRDMIELMVNANDDEEYAQTLIVFDESFKRHELHNEVSSRICPELLRRMISDLGNEKLQERGIKILNDLLERGESVSGAIEDFIDEHPEDASVARFGLGLIDGSFVYDFMRDLYGFTTKNMTRHENDPVVQEYAMRILALANVENNYPIAEWIEDPGVLHACLQAMRNHPNNLRVLEAACEALYLFANDCVIDQEWPPATILQALNNNVHCATFQANACCFLGQVLENVKRTIKNDGREYFEEKWPTLGGEELFLAGRDYVEAILQAMQTHPTNEEVQGKALYVLERMTNESASLNRIIQAGGVDLVVQAMQFFKGRRRGETECLSAVVILNPLFGCSTDARRKAIELGAIPMLLEVMRQDNSFEHGYWDEHERRISGCGAACASLNELFLENIDRAVSLQIANEGGIPLIVDTIGEYVEPVSLPLTERINRFHHCFKLKDGDILTQVAMFPADDGKLPLHYAAHRGNESHQTGRMAVLEHLLKVYPEAATVRDGSGQLPLHIAIESRASLSIIEVLLRANPDAGDAVCRRSNDTMLNFPPVLMAAASDCDLECIFSLLRHAPTITKTQVTSISRKRKSPPA